MLKDIGSDNVLPRPRWDYISIIIQKSIENPELLEEFSDQMVTYRKRLFPVMHCDFSRSRETPRYDNGLKQILPGGLYVVKGKRKVRLPTEIW